MENAHSYIYDKRMNAEQIDAYIAFFEDMRVHILDISAISVQDAIESLHAIAFNAVKASETLRRENDQ